MDDECRGGLLALVGECSESVLAVKNMLMLDSAERFCVAKVRARLSETMEKGEEEARVKKRKKRNVQK